VAETGLPALTEIWPVRHTPWDQSGAASSAEPAVRRDLVPLAALKRRTRTPREVPHELRNYKQLSGNGPTTGVYARRLTILTPGAV
jgi:hypothetical protein